MRRASVAFSLIAGALLAFTGLATVAAAPADAAAYRFWSYWLGSSTGWSFSSQGASRVPADGTVDGWRFAVSEATTSSSPPRHSPSFQRICGNTPPSDGKKRVGLVVDFGTNAEAPDGESPHSSIVTCVVAPTSANGYDILASVVTLRVNDGLICGMDGYPATECGAPVAEPSPTHTPSNSPGQTGSSGGTPKSDEPGQGGQGGGTSSSTPVGADPSATESASSGGNGKSSHNRGPSTKQQGHDHRDSSKPNPALSPKPEAGINAALVDSTPSPAPGESRGSRLGVLLGLVVIGGLAAAAFVVRWRRT